MYNNIINTSINNYNFLLLIFNSNIALITEYIRNGAFFFREKKADL